jgi:hypothetical protein
LYKNQPTHSNIVDDFAKIAIKTDFAKAARTKKGPESPSLLCSIRD